MNEDSWHSEDYSSGIQITREGAELTISPSFEGANIPYYDKKPEVVEARLSKISSKPIYRVRIHDSEARFAYVSDYTENCKLWKPIALACHMSEVYPDLVREHIVGTGLGIQCKTNFNEINKCDDIVRKLIIKASESSFLP